MNRITYHVVQEFQVWTYGIRLPTAIGDILASFLGDDGHLYKKCHLVLVPMKVVLLVFVLLKGRVKSCSAEFSCKGTGRVEPLPQVTSPPQVAYCGGSRTPY